jgi:hypothetical protein
LAGGAIFAGWTSAFFTDSSLGLISGLCLSSGSGLPLTLTLSPLGRGLGEGVLGFDFAVTFVGLIALTALGFVGLGFTALTTFAAGFFVAFFFTAII